jgi:hypothetical protein
VGTGTVPAESPEGSEQFLKPVQGKRKPRHHAQEREGIGFESSKVCTRHLKSPWQRVTQHHAAEFFFAGAFFFLASAHRFFEASDIFFRAAALSFRF